MTENSHQFWGRWPK